jgi:hypothetical protein
MTSYRATELPPELAARLRQAYGLDTSPGTLGEFVDLRTGLLPNAAMNATTLCRSSPSRHELVLAGQVLFTHCVLDTLLLPLVEEKDAHVRSTSPVSGNIIELEITMQGVKAEPEGAVISYGMRRESSGTFYETGCPYINAFRSLLEYEIWARQTAEAVTIALPVRDAFEFARDIVSRTRIESE